MVSWALPLVRSPVLQSWAGKSLLRGAGAGIPAHMQVLEQGSSITLDVAQGSIGV